MKIQGLQKMTLLDYPGKVACTIFLAGCDFKCPFCHNAELIDGSAEPVMDDLELMSFLETRTKLLDGVCFTGGEPSLRKDLPDLLRRIKALGYPVKLDTNGAHPDLVIPMIEEGLIDYVAMDVKNSKDLYPKTIGLEVADLDAVQKSIDYLLNGSIDYEFRTTVVEQLHSEESFRAIGPWIQGAKQYYLQPFTDRDSVVFSGLTAPSEEALQRYADIVRPYVNVVGIRG